jgi:hypothetical protein
MTIRQKIQFVALCGISILILIGGFNNADGHIRAHNTAYGAVNTVIGPGLIHRKMPLCVYLICDLKHFFGAEIHTKFAAFAPFRINNMFIRH